MCPPGTHDTTRPGRPWLSNVLPTPTYSRPSGPSTIESTVWRPTRSPSSATEWLAKRCPSKPVNAVTRPFEAEVTCAT